MSLVAGEDSESDEEINTDQLHEAAAGRSGNTKKGALPRAGIVAGEDSEEEGTKMIIYPPFVTHVHVQFPGLQMRKRKKEQMVGELRQ